MAIALKRAYRFCTFGRQIPKVHDRSLQFVIARFGSCSNEKYRDGELDAHGPRPTPNSDGWGQLMDPR